MHKIRNGAILRQVRDFLSDGNSLCSLSSLSLAVYEIYANQVKLQKFDLENECHCQGCEKRDLRDSPGNIQFSIDDFFSQNLYPTDGGGHV